MHPDQRRLVGLLGVTRRIEPARVAQAEGQVGQPVDDAAVGDDLEAAVVGVHGDALGRGQPVDQAFSRRVDSG